MNRRIPVTLITGFLGAGKTTLLNRLVSSPEEKFALLVNEVGAIHIDEALIERGDEEMIELTNGCICCSIRADLRDTLLRIAKKRKSGEMIFDRLVIETTGIADPGPILQTFYFEPAIEQQFSVSSVVTLVDGAHFDRNLVYEEAVKQIGFADVVLLNKIDLLDQTKAWEVKKSIEEINPSAKVIETVQSDVSAKELFETFHFPAEEERRLSLRQDASIRAGETFTALTIVEERPLDQSRFAAVLREVLEAYGEDLYRYKGILRFDGTDAKIILQGTGMIYGTARRGTFTEDPKSTLVFIGKNLDEAAIRRGVEAAVCHG